MLNVCLTLQLSKELIGCIPDLQTGESEVTRVTIMLPHELRGFTHRVEFRRPDGSKTPSELLEEYDDGEGHPKISVNLTNGLLTLPGEYRMEYVGCSEKAVFVSKPIKFKANENIGAMGNVVEPFPDALTTLSRKEKLNNLTIETKFSKFLGKGKFIEFKIPIDNEIKRMVENGDCYLDLYKLRTTRRKVQKWAHPQINIGYGTEAFYKSSFSKGEYRFGQDIKGFYGEIEPTIKLDQTNIVTIDDQMYILVKINIYEIARQMAYCKIENQETNKTDLSFYEFDGGLNANVLKPYNAPENIYSKFSALNVVGGKARSTASIEMYAPTRYLKLKYVLRVGKNLSKFSDIIKITYRHVPEQPACVYAVSINIE